MTESRRRDSTHTTTVGGPQPLVPAPPRYSPEPLPPYRFVPGLNPHPHRDPGGHRVRGPQPPPSWSPDEWPALAAYLYAIDLYNHAYWWECHEVLEALWHAAGRKSAPGRFLQGLIHAAAANLNRHRGHLEAARRQTTRALERLDERTPDGHYMGIDVADLTRRLRESADGQTNVPPTIRLTLPEWAAGSDAGRTA